MISGSALNSYSQQSAQLALPDAHFIQRAPSLERSLHDSAHQQAWAAVLPMEQDIHPAAPLPQCGGRPSPVHRRRVFWSQLLEVMGIEIRLNRFRDWNAKFLASLGGARRTIAVAEGGVCMEMQIRIDLIPVPGVVAHAFATRANGQQPLQSFHRVQSDLQGRIGASGFRSPGGKMPGQKSTQSRATKSK